MQTGVIVLRKAMEVIPPARLETLLKAYPAGWGAAIANGENVIVAKGFEADVELIQNTIEEFQKKDIAFFFANSTSKISEDDLSPFTILHKDNQPQLVAFIEGKFPSHEKMNASHPAEFFIANEFLIPRLSDVWEMTDGDIQKVMAYIQKDHFKKDLLINALDRAYVTFVPSKGAPVSYHVGDTHKAEKFGFMSNTGPVEKPVVKEEPKKEEPPKKSMFAGKSTVREKAVPASNNVAAVVQPEKTETATIKNYQTVKVSPAMNMSRSQRKDWYKSRVGFLPDGWKEGVAIEVYKDGEGKVLTLGEVKKLGLAAVGLPKLNNPEPSKDTRPEHVTSAMAKPTEKKVSDKILPIISPNSREYVLKMLNEKAELLTDPKSLKLETKFPTLSAQLDEPNLDKILPMLSMMENAFAICKDRPDAGGTIIVNLANIILTSRQSKEIASPSQVDPPVEEKPVKKSMFAKKAA